MTALLLAALALGAETPSYYIPPLTLATDFGSYRSPLLFDDGTPVKTAADWKRRREEILKYWHGQMGEWPPLIAKPKLEIVKTEQRGTVTQHAIKIQTAPGRIVDDAFLLVPEGNGPFPAVVVVFYEAKTGVGLGKAEQRDFAIQLAKRGFVALSLGGAPETYYPNQKECRLQPLSFHAYEAANCHTALANRPDVDPKRIGIVGHSYGGKWAMLASCLHEPFACAAWSDPGIVFDEKRGNVNYWERWYLGFDPELKMQRQPGIPSEKNPRTGPYKQMIADKRDLHELHALMAPRPFLVSGGSEDLAERWKPLNHSIAVNKLLGVENRVALTLRPGHSPTPESNEQLYGFFESVLKPK